MNIAGKAGVAMVYHFADGEQMLVRLDELFGHDIPAILSYMTERHGAARVEPRPVPKAPAVPLDVQTRMDLVVAARRLAHQLRDAA